MATQETVKWFPFSETATGQYNQVKYLIKIKGVIKTIHFKKILCCMCVSGALSFPVRMFHLGNFISLVISSAVFFGSYFLILLVWKEPLIVEIYFSLKNKIVKK